MSLAVPARLRNDIRAPAEFADAVELYARKSGRSGKLKFVPPPVNCWVVELSLKANDKALAGFQAGKLEDEPTEIVYLWRPSTPTESAKRGSAHLVGYKLDELGVTAMIELLERTDTFSGRGQYASHTEAARDQFDKGEAARAKIVAERRENTRDMAEEYRRSINKIPLLGVGIELPKTAPTAAPGAEK